MTADGLLQPAMPYFAPPRFVALKGGLKGAWRVGALRGGWRAGALRGASGAAALMGAWREAAMATSWTGGNDGTGRGCGNR